MRRFVNQVNMTAIVSSTVELRTTKTGKKVDKFSIGIPTERDGETTWESFLIEVWEKTAEACAQTLTKDSKVFVSGELKQDRWDAPEGTQSRVYIRANQVEFLRIKAPDNG